MPLISLDGLLEQEGLARIDLVLCDVQGAEVDMLAGAARALAERRVRFWVLSTHHHRIRGDALTHQRCLEILKRAGAHITAERSVPESHSGDGLIVASLDDHDRDLTVDVSRAGRVTRFSASLRRISPRRSRSATRFKASLPRHEWREAAGAPAPTPEDTTAAGDRGSTVRRVTHLLRRAHGSFSSRSAIMQQTCNDDGVVDVAAGGSPGPDDRPALSIVVPLFRDQDSLGPIFERCLPVLSQAGGGELVLVDDGGLDATTPRAAVLARDYPYPVTIVRLARNFGQHPAVFAGLEHARGDVVATLDSDLQYPPEELPAMLAEVSPEWPVISGYRAERQDPPIRRLLTRALTRWLNARTRTNLRDFGSMFRVYDRRTVDLMLQITERHRYVPAVVAWLGVPIKEVPVRHEPRGEQGSRYRLSALVEMVLDLVTGYSVFPLRVMTAVGLAASGLGFVATLLFAIYRVAEGGGVSGTVSAFALIFALSGVQLLLIALVGEYVGRIYTESKGRPYYLVSEVRRTAPGPVGRATLHGTSSS